MRTGTADRQLQDELILDLFKINNALSKSERCFTKTFWSTHCNLLFKKITEDFFYFSKTFLSTSPLILIVLMYDVIKKQNLLLCLKNIFLMSLANKAQEPIHMQHVEFYFLFYFKKLPHATTLQ